MDSFLRESLDFWTCLFLDPPTGPVTLPPRQNASPTWTVYDCEAYGKYYLSVDPSRIWTNGHYICLGLFLLTGVVSLAGMVLNVLNVMVLRKSQQGSSLRDLLIILACVEWIVCFSAVVFSYFILNVLENLNRSRGVYQWFRVSNIAFAISRTASIYMSILVTIERFLVVAFPAQSKTWLSPWRSRAYLGVVAILSVALNTPLIFNWEVSTLDQFDLFPAQTHVENFPYIFKDTHFTNEPAKEILDVMNYVAPFPVLLFFNILLYKSIYDWTRSRVRLTGSHKREINAAKMFSMVAVILVVCHTISCVIFYTDRFQQLIYREVIFLQFVCVATGASANFVVYYSFSRSFKKEFKRLLSSMNVKKFCTCSV